jgi:Xaa-Pro aminopeptidase
VIDFTELKIDALLVSGLPNIRYFSGFTGSNAFLLVTHDSQTLFTDPRYTVQASQECNCAVRTVTGRALHVAAAQFIQRKRLKKIGFEKARLSYEGYQLLKEHLPLGATLKPLAGVVEKLRMIKTGDEIARIRRSVITNSEAFDRTLKRMEPGVSESSIAAELEYQMRLLGAEKPAFETIVAAGPHSALPHASPTEQLLAANELLLIDMGAFQSGYASDMTRTVFLGKPDARTRSMYRAVLEAQQAAISAVRPGITAQQVDRVARKVLKEHGLAKEFVHSTGHGLGLEIHEPPRLGKNDKTTLAAGMVITIEPGAYVEGTGGVRIEDTVVVTNSGCEVLTPTSKEMMFL